MLSPAMLALVLAFQDPSSSQLPTPEAARLPQPTYPWRDFDRDGRTDVYVRSPAREDRLLWNRGDAFEDVTVREGLAGLASTQAATWTDFEDDGLPDLFVVAADGSSRLYHNAGTSFVDVTGSAGVSHAGPVAFYEWIPGEKGGLDDLHVVTPVEDVLYRNLGSTRFAAIPLPTGGAPGEVVAFGGGRIAPDADRPQASGAAPKLERTDDRRRGSDRLVLPGSGGTANLGACGTLDIEDQGAPGCLQASSVPTLGMLYPLSSNLFVDGIGQVGIGTTSPTRKLDVAGFIRTRSGGVQFPDGTIQRTAQALVSSYATGAGNDPSSTLQFLAPPAVVSVAAGQKVLAVSSKGLGTH